MKVLVGSKLNGRALSWFHSKPEHISMSSDKLLAELKKIFNQRPSRVYLREQFEDRLWKKGESFYDYIHDKTILANKVPIDECQRIEYFVEGIPDVMLRDQARINRFDSVEKLLMAFEKVSLAGRPGSSTPTQSINKLTKAAGKKDEFVKKERNDSSTQQSPRCYNCEKRGHISSDCERETIPKGACYGCGSPSHQVGKCPKKKGEQKEIANLDEIRIDDNFYPSVDLLIDFEGEEFNINSRALLDSGSPVS